MDGGEKPRDDDNAEEKEDANIIEVFESNWNTVQAFKFSSWTIHLAPNGQFIHQDMSSAEIRSTCIMLKIPRDEWDRILIGISQHMIPVAREFLNNRESGNSAPIRPPQ